jgi:tripartite-type tricarboxylate transporter receptor subunit TctC
MAFPSDARTVDWPTRPVTMVVPFAPGGPVDVLGRILAQYLGEVIDKQVIVDNVPGAGGMTGSLRVSQAAPDGHMFVLGSIGTHALNQTLSEVALRRRRRLRSVALIADVGLVLITRRTCRSAISRNSSFMPRPTKARCSSARAGPAPPRISVACC